MDIFKIIFLALFVNNIALSKFLGVRQLGGTSNFSGSIKKSLILFPILLISGIILFLINDYLLAPYKLTFLYTFIIVMVNFSVALALSNIFKSISQSDRLEISTNSVVIGVCLLIFGDTTNVNFPEMLIYITASVAGYLLLTVIVAAISEHMRLTGIPKIMKGFPIMLITLGVLALAFIGLTGIFK